MEFNLERLVRTNIVTLEPYTSARGEYSGSADVLLDANENPYGVYNRYPDPLQKTLKRRVSEIKKVGIDTVFIGNGSDEVIDIAFRVFCNPRVDKALTFTPTYGLYKVAASINDVELIELPLTNEWQIDLEQLEPYLQDEQLKVIFICSPNNPTGNLIDSVAIDSILQRFKGVVVLDEAYIDFAPQQSFIYKLDRYPNLIVSQTLSKAYGMAGLRVGLAFMGESILKLYNKVKPPYNVSTVNQQKALELLEAEGYYNSKLHSIISEREELKRELSKFAIVKRLYPSDSNFLLIEVEDGEMVYNHLKERGVIVRNRSSSVKNSLRITVGTPEENRRLLVELRRLNGRRAHLERKTAETDIRMELNLDGSGRADISTGIHFFDHLLKQLSRHGLVDLKIKVVGDLLVDQHHTVEDTAIALGELFAKALGDKLGLERYGFCLPMDDCLAQVAIDFGGRSWLVWDANFKREMVGELPTELFYHFFKSFCDGAKANLNIKAEGDNEHHKIEAIFKTFAKAVKAAIKRDTDLMILPSTKEVL